MFANVKNPFELKAEDAHFLGRDAFFGHWQIFLLKIYIKFIYSPKNLCCSTSHDWRKKSFDKFSKYEER